jgi:hypothetical protein
MKLINIILVASILMLVMGSGMATYGPITMRTGANITGSDTSYMLNMRADINKGVANIKDFGAKCDNATNDTVAINLAFASGAGKVVFPSGIAYIGEGTITVPSYVHVDMGGANSVIRYTGSGAAFSITNRKGIIWTGGKIDLLGASPGAIGIDINGLWNAVFTLPTIFMGPGTTAVDITTHNWGAYCISFINPYFWGEGAYGIKADQTPGDTGRHVTYLTVWNGWIMGPDYDIWLNETAHGGIYQTCLEQATYDCLSIGNSSNMFIQPGETGPGSGYYGIKWRSGNSRMIQQVTQGNTVDYSLYIPTNFATHSVYLHGSDVLQNYTACLYSAYNPAKAVILNGMSGGTEKEILAWSDTLGLSLASYGGITSTGGPLHVAGAPPTARLTDTRDLASGLYDNTWGGRLQWYTKDASGSGAHVGASINAYYDVSSTTTPAFDLVFNTSEVTATATEKMRLTRSGNLIIGGTAATSKLQVVGLSSYATDAAAGSAGLTAGAFYINTTAAVKGAVYAKL